MVDDDFIGPVDFVGNLRRAGFDDFEIQQILRGDTVSWVGTRLVQKGPGFVDFYSKLAYEKPPEGIIDKMLWYIGVLGQLLQSMIMFPVALGLFLLEEAVQSGGMGAYILSSAKEWDALETYLPGWFYFMDVATSAAKNLAPLNPITGGAVLLYLGMAQQSAAAFSLVARRKLEEQIQKETEKGERAEFEQTHSTLRLSSTPTNAEIWMDGVNTELLTPQTFKDMEPGKYALEVRRYSVRRETWDVYAFEITLEGGYRKEIHVRIPEAVTGEEEMPDQHDEAEERKLPDWITAEVEGEYAIDGDTFVTTTGERVRILGIDAPELGRPYSDEAGAYLDDLIHGKNITMKIQSHLPIDKFGRTLAKCKMYKGDIAELLLTSGLARHIYVEDDRYDPTVYKLAEDAAKERRVGIWS